MNFPRFTIRRQMLMVAGLGLMLGGAVTGYRRHDTFLQLAKHHERLRARNETS